MAWQQRSSLESKKESPVYDDGTGASVRMIVYGTITSIVLSSIYAYVSIHIPLVYLRAFLTVALGIGIGLAVGAGGGSGSRRAVLHVAGLLFGLLAVYWAWFVHILVVTREWRIDPLALWGAIVELQQNTSIVIGHFGNASTVSGGTLSAIWVGEAILIAGLATYKSASIAHGTESMDK